MGAFAEVIVTNRCYLWRARRERVTLRMMAGPVNLADPDVEPTDAQLTELALRAFSDVRKAHEISLQRLRDEVSKTRVEVLRTLDHRAAPPDPV